MIIDGLLLFDSAFALTVTAPSTNVIDLLNARDIGVGDHPGMEIMFEMLTPLLSAGATTLQVQAQGSTDNSTYTTYAETPAIGKAALTAGRYVLPISWPRPDPGAALPRYLRLNYIVATGPFTGGTITAALVLDRQDNVNYPAGVTVAN
jgi:hypothetical protein